MAPGAAARTLCRDVAREILAGEVGPGVGAQRMWDLSEHLSPEPQHFHRLILAADLWECEPEHQSSYREDILTVAQALLDGASGSAGDR